MRILLILLIFVGCTNKNKSVVAKYTDSDLSSQKIDLIIPNTVWEQIMELYRPMVMDAAAQESGEGGHGGGEGGHGGGESSHGGGKEEHGAKKEEHGKPEGHGEEAKPEDAEGGANLISADRFKLRRRPPVEPLPITVYLREETKGVLGGESFKIRFAPGGGKLDLQPYVSKKRGGFFLKVETDTEIPDDEFKVMFLSNSKRVKIDDEEYGNGCNKQIDLTKFWFASMKKGGISLVTTDGRYALVLAGSYFIATSQKGKLRIAQLDITDSRYKDNLCTDRRIGH